MTKIRGYIFAAITIVVAACSSDVADAHSERDPSSTIEIIPINKSSSSGKSSSSFPRINRTDIFFSNHVVRSSSSIAPSSSSKTPASSSSSQPAQQSSSSKAKSSSSEVKSSSSEQPKSSSSSTPPSSSSEPKSSASLRFYDCNQYNCVTTEFLNPDISYGELLDKRDNQVYRTLVISNHVWTAQNMNYEIVNEEGKSKNNWCYNDDPEYCKKFGRLYNWEAAQKACPEGWHLPTADEWLELIEDHTCEITQERDFPKQYHCAGTSLKTVDGWEDGLTNTNEYGFSVMAAGFKVPKGFGGEGVMGEFWTSTDETETYAAFVEFGRVQDYAEIALIDKSNGLSVRCVKGDAE